MIDVFVVKFLIFNNAILQNTTVMSGLTFGFTGSYIFSQTIFTYRTGVHSRLIGLLIMVVFLYIVVSPVNVLEISPLFFLGSTLIFIGYDLMYEWLWEVREMVFLSEYFIVWFTFCSIHVFGIDFGIIIGVLIAIIEQAVINAQSSSIGRVEKRSRAVWTPSDAKILHEHAYRSFSPKIVTIEVIGTVFFGSALSLFNQITDEIGLQMEDEADAIMSSPRTPHTSSSILTLERKPSFFTKKSNARQIPPKYLVLDLMRVSNLDASASRGCFLQLVKMCAKKDILVCASGLTPKIEWMFRSHKVSFEDLQEEESVKAQILSREYNKTEPLEKILLFATIQEALEFSETSLIQRLNIPDRSGSSSQSLSQIVGGPNERSLANVLAYVLGASEQDREILERLSDERYHDEVEVKSGGIVFHKNTHSDSFYVVLRGCVAYSSSNSREIARQEQPVLSGAGLVTPKRVLSASNLFDADFLQQQRTSPGKSTVATLWQIGGIFGYNDFLLERPRSFQVLGTMEGTKVARFSHSQMNLLQSEDPALYALMQRVLLHACTLDLANCTCHDV